MKIKNENLFSKKFDLPENPFSKRGFLWWFVIPFFIFFFFSFITKASASEIEVWRFGENGFFGDINNTNFDDVWTNYVQWEYGQVNLYDGYFASQLFEYNGYVRFYQSAGMSTSLEFTPSENGFSYSWWDKEQWQNYSSGLTLSAKTVRGGQEVNYFWSKRSYGPYMYAGSDVGNGGSFIQIDQNFSTSRGNWYHFVVNVSKDKASIYKNGVLSFEYEFNNQISFSSDISKIRFDNDYNSEYFLTDLAVFNRLLTEQEIVGIYESEASIYDYEFTSSGIFNIEILEDPLMLNRYADKEVNFSFNFCDNYGNIKEANFGYGDLRNQGKDDEWIDNLVRSERVNLRDIKLSPQICTGIKTFVLDKADIDMIDHELINPVWYVEYLDNNDNYIDEIYPVNYTFSTSTENYLESGVVSPLNVDIDKNTGHINIAFNYNFENLDWEDSEVCLYNYSGYQNSTNYCADITKAKGYGIISIPVPEVPVNFKFYFQSSISNNLKSDAFLINFTNEFFKDKPFRWTELTNRELACSQEEWDTPDPVIGIEWLNATTSVPAFNFTKLKCKTITTLYNTTDRITDYLKGTLENIIEQIKAIFPFNIPAKIAESWKNSKNRKLPAGLDFLEQFDKNGNISLDLSSLTGTTTNEMILFGPDIIENENWTNLTRGLREFFKYLFWALFIYYAVYKRGERVYYKLKDEI